MQDGKALPEGPVVNGSAVVAMVGKNCFAIASDRRLGVQLQTIATDFQKIYRIHDKLFLGLSGLGTDAQTLYVSVGGFVCFGLICHCLPPALEMKVSTACLSAQTVPTS